MSKNVALVAAALIVASCAGGGDPAEESVDPSRSDAVEAADASGTADDGEDASDVDTADPDATVELVGFELRWALDDEPVGDVVDYDQPIDWDRQLAGIDAVATFALAGEPGDVDADVRRPVQVNGDPIEGLPITRGPERGTTIPDSELETSVDDDTLTVRWNVGRPMSPVTLVEERAEFAETLGLDPDAEDVLFGDPEDLEIEVDLARIIDLPLAPVDGANDYEYDLVGTIRLSNGFELEVNEEIGLRSVETERPTIDAVDCTASVLATIEQVVQGADGSDGTDDHSGLVLVGDLRALDRLDDRVESTDCDPGFATVSLCAAAGVADADGITGPGVEIARGYCAVDAFGATAGVPTLVDGAVHLVVPAGRDGEPAMRVALSAPAAADWSLLDQGSGADGQYATGVWRHDEYGVGASLAVGTEPADGADDALADHVQPLLDTDLVISEGPFTVADRPGYRLTVDQEFGYPAYEVTLAFALDEERLVDIALRIADRNIVTNLAAVEAYVDCIASSVVVTPFALTPRPAPAVDCSSLDPTEAVVQEQVDASTPTTTTTVFVEAGAPAYEQGLLTIPLGTGARTGEPPSTVTLATPAWPLGELDDGQTSPGVVLDAPVRGSSFRAAISFTGSDPGDFEKALERFLDPANDSEVVLNDSTTSVAGREVRVKLAEYESISDDIIRTGVIVMPVDAGRTLHVSLALAPEDSIDLAAEIDRIVSSIGVTG